MQRQATVPVHHSVTMATFSSSATSFVSCTLLLLAMACTGQEEGVGGSVLPADPASGGGQNGAAVPAMFIFGDSLIDNGNNNGLASFAKADYYPYGIDFPGGPTGRFCNGLTMVDEIANLLGLPLIPAHSEASGHAARYGLNYASAAAGILDNTGQNFVARIPFNQQIANFKSTLDQMTDNLGADDVSRAMNHCLFFVGMGSNDYLNNYLMPNYDTRNLYDSEQFADLLVQQYAQQLTSLYNLGARKFAISGLGSLGCIPSILAKSPDGKCSDEVDRALVFPFNDRVKATLGSLSANLPGSRFIYIDIYRMFMDILADPQSYGFNVVDTGCCGVGKNRGQITCLPMETPCPDRKEYVFWDAFHPTEAVNVVTARRAFSGGADVVFPVNIQQLADLDVQ